MKKNILMMVVIASFATGCSHYHRVTDSNSNSVTNDAVQVHVEIGSKEVKEGEVVNVYTRTCSTERRQTKGHQPHTCKMNKVGEAVVAKVVSEEAALVKALDGLVIDTKMYVEKKGSK